MINIGSIDGHAVGPFDNWAYPPSKAALHQLTRVLACRLATERDHRQLPGARSCRTRR